MRNHRPGTLLAIGITCATCGHITVTPGLNADEVVPFAARTAERTRTAVPEPFMLAPGVVLGDREELTRVDQLSVPRQVPAEPFTLSSATLASACAEYDELTGGQLAAHRREVDPLAADAASGRARLPQAWALARLETLIAKPEWWRQVQEPDTAAGVQLGAFREFPMAWARHPLFAAMAASAAATGFSLHALAVFAAARCLSETGNKVDFTKPSHAGDPIEAFHLATSPTERLAVLARRLDRFDWPGGRAAEAATARAALIDALIASQGRINARQPGILVLSTGVVRRGDDPILIQSTHQTLQERGRRHRGLAAVVLMLPKLYPAPRPDQAGFGWLFVPCANPHHAGGGIQLVAPASDTRQSAPVV